MTEKGKKYLSDILQAISLIEEFVSDIQNFDNYVKDKKTRSAVERQLSIIGEAVSKYSKDNPDDAIAKYSANHCIQKLADTRLRLN